MNTQAIQFLQSEQGQKLLTLAHQYPKIEARIAALKKESKLSKNIDHNMIAAVSQQVSLREKAISKFRCAKEMLFDSEGLEQSTNEFVSEYVANRFQSFETIADLTCGIGGDAINLARNSVLLTVDILPQKVMMCRHNLHVYERTCIPIVANVENYYPKADAYFIDPARRSGEKRVFTLEESIPGIKTINKLLEKTGFLAIKASAGLNYDRLPFNCEVEVISYENECKEVVLWCGDFCQGSRKATILPENISLENISFEPEVTELKSFLYEPHKAAIRAHLLHVLAKEHNLNLLDHSLSYLTGDYYIDSPWLKSYQIFHTMPFSEKKVKAFIRKENLDIIYYKSRGFWGDEGFWRKRLQVKSNGNIPKILFLTRIQQQAIAIFTEMNHAL